MNKSLFRIAAPLVVCAQFLLTAATVEVKQVRGQAPPDAVEISGVSAAAFDPALWQNNQLHWVADVRVPLLSPRLGGLWRNIYAPSVIQEPYGWRLFYGAWDGVYTSNDRIYSLTTRDFIDFDNHSVVIDHGVFEHVCNVNVQKIEDGSYHMLCTAYPDKQNTNKPIYFSSRDGKIWNGSPEPHPADYSEIVRIDNYGNYRDGDFNGANVLLRDQGRWLLYFNNWRDPNKLYWAEGSNPKQFTLQGIALETGHAVNDVKKFHAKGKDWYLMGLHRNGDTVWQSLSNDGKQFAEEKILFRQLYDEDKYIVALGYVTQGDRLLGVVYGAGPVPQLNRNRLFARWLQKKVVIESDSGEVTLQGSLGPDRQRFHLPSMQPVPATLTVFAEDGITRLASTRVTFQPGRAYQLAVE